MASQNMGTVRASSGQDVLSANEESDDGGMWQSQKKKSGKVKAKAKFVCKGGKKTCGLVLSDGDDSVRCDWCEDWYHPKCQGLTVDAFRALSKYDFVWVCLGCRPNLMSMQKQGKQLENKLDEVEDKILKAINASRGIESNKEVEKTQGFGNNCG